jgi:hypothetical protein
MTQMDLVSKRKWAFIKNIRIFFARKVFEVPQKEKIAETFQFIHKIGETPKSRVVK